MKSTYAIDVSDNLLRKTHHGVITVDDEIELLNTIFADPKFHSGMDAICDFTEATVDWSLPELDRFRAYISRIKTMAGKSKWAIVFPAGKNKSTAKIFIALHEAFEDTISVKLFENTEDAKVWIKGTSA